MASVTTTFPTVLPSLSAAVPATARSVRLVLYFHRGLGSDKAAPQSILNPDLGHEARDLLRAYQKSLWEERGSPMVTQIEVREGTSKFSKAKTVKSSSGSLTVAQKKLRKRKYKKAEALRGSVSSAWGRQALSELKNPSTLPSNVRNAREGVRIQAGGERTRPSDVEGRKLTLAKERPAWHEPFLQPQAILLLRLFLHVSQ